MNNFDGVGRTLDRFKRVHVIWTVANSRFAPPGKINFFRNFHFGRTYKIHTSQTASSDVHENRTFPEQNSFYSRFVFFSLYVRAIDLLGPTWAASKFCGSRHNTYFVPTNYAFEKLDDAELRRTLDSPAYARRMLDNHRADRVLPSTLIKQRGWQYEFRTENEITVRMAYGSNGLTVKIREKPPYFFFDGRKSLEKTVDESSRVLCIRVVFNEGDQWNGAEGR